MKKNYLKSLFFVAGGILSMNATAQFSGPFAPANWTLYSVGAGSDAYVDVSGAPGTIVFGGNDSGAGGCCALYDEYSITIPCGDAGNGTINFDWSFVQPDIESFLYVVNGAATTVTGSTSSGILSIPVSAGDVFAFRILTQDDCCGQGVLTVTNFSYSDADLTAPIPDVALLADATGECSVTPAAPTATDNCSGAITGTTLTTFPISTFGTTIVTWTYTDVSGNTSTQDQNVVVTDATAPVADLVTLADESGTCSVTPAAPTATDNCMGTIIGTPSVAFPITVDGITVVTWTYDDGNGNTSTQDQNVIVDNPLTLVTTFTDEMLGNDGTIDLTITFNSGATTIDWDNDGTGDNDDTEDLSGLVAGTYTVVVTDAGGCTNSATVTINSQVGLSENNVNFSIYPNPTSNFVTIKLNNQSAQNAQLLNNIGQVVGEYSFHSSTMEINMNEFENGIYFIRFINDENDVYTAKVIKQ